MSRRTPTKYSPHGNNMVYHRNNHQHYQIDENSFDNNFNHQKYQNNSQRPHSHTVGKNNLNYDNIYLEESSGLEEIEKMLNSSRGEYHSKEDRGYQLQEITFLKEKLIETHSKLLKQLDNNNKILDQIEKVQKQLQSKEKSLKQLESTMRQLEIELDQAKRQLSNRQQKHDEKYRSIENKLQDESRRNNQLKEDLESMRGKILQTIMQKNMLQQANTQFKVELRAFEQGNSQFQEQIRQVKEDNKMLSRELEGLREKYSELLSQVHAKDRELEEMNRSFFQRKNTSKEFEHLLKLEQDKNHGLFKEITEIQNENNHWQNKVVQLQKQLEKQKYQLFQSRQKQEIETSNFNQHITKLTYELNKTKQSLQSSQKQLSLLRTRPGQDAQKKRRHYEITKEFVNQLENEQSMYGNGSIRGINQNQSKGSYRVENSGISPHGRSATYFQNQNKNLILRPTNSTNYGNYSQQKHNYHENLNDVGQLESALFNCNIERKKIKGEIDKIEQNKVKTREMVVKKKRLQEQLEYQQQKIKKVKEQLRKLRIS